MKKYKLVRSNRFLNENKRVNEGFFDFLKKDNKSESKFLNGMSNQKETDDFNEKNKMKKLNKLSDQIKMFFKYFSPIAKNQNINIYNSYYIKSWNTFEPSSSITETLLGLDNNTHKFDEEIKKETFKTISILDSYESMPQEKIGNSYVYIPVTQTLFRYLMRQSGENIEKLAMAGDLSFPLCYTRGENNPVKIKNCTFERISNKGYYMKLHIGAIYCHLDLIKEAL